MYVLQGPSLGSCYYSVTKQSYHAYRGHREQQRIKDLNGIIVRGTSLVSKGKVYAGTIEEKSCWRRCVSFAIGM